MPLLYVLSIYTFSELCQFFGLKIGSKEVKLWRFKMWSIGWRPLKDISVQQISTLILALCILQPVKVVTPGQVPSNSPDRLHIIMDQMATHNLYKCHTGSSIFLYTIIYIEEVKSLLLWHILGSIVFMQVIIHPDIATRCLNTTSRCPKGYLT